MVVWDEKEKEIIRRSYLNIAYRLWSLIFCFDSGEIYFIYNFLKILFFRLSNKIKKKWEITILIRDFKVWFLIKLIDPYNYFLPIIKIKINNI
jgi:hypothetical protein